MRAGDKEKIGPHGLEVTRLGMGGTTFGNMYSVLSEQGGTGCARRGFCGRSALLSTLRRCMATA